MTLVHHCTALQDDEKSHKRPYREFQGRHVPDCRRPGMITKDKVRILRQYGRRRNRQDLTPLDTLPSFRTPGVQPPLSEAGFTNSSTLCLLLRRFDREYTYAVRKRHHQFNTANSQPGRYDCRNGQIRSNEPTCKDTLKPGSPADASVYRQYAARTQPLRSP